jgi:hypothetical protein
MLHNCSQTPIKNNRKIAIFFSKNQICCFTLKQTKQFHVPLMIVLLQQLEVSDEKLVNIADII